MEVGCIPIEKICEVKTGAPMSRAKKIIDGDVPIQARVLVPAAMTSNFIDDGQLVTENVSRVKDEMFTREGDVIVKASTPYDCVYIDDDHVGLLVTSYCFILRPFEDIRVDMRYLAAYLGFVRSQGALQDMSKGETIQLIKRKDLAHLPVPIPEPKKQERLARLFECVQRSTALCRSVMVKTELLLDSELSRLVMDGKAKKNNVPQGGKPNDYGADKEQGRRHLAKDVGGGYYQSNRGHHPTHLPYVHAQA